MTFTPNFHFEYFAFIAWGRDYLISAQYANRGTPTNIILSRSGRGHIRVTEPQLSNDACWKYCLETHL